MLLRGVRLNYSLFFLHYIFIAMRNTYTYAFTAYNNYNNKYT